MGDAEYPCRFPNQRPRPAPEPDEPEKSGDQPTAGSDRTTFDHFGTISRSRSSVNRSTSPTSGPCSQTSAPPALVPFKLVRPSNQPRRARPLAGPPGIECFCVSCGTIAMAFSVRQQLSAPRVVVSVCQRLTRWVPSRSQPGAAAGAGMEWVVRDRMRPANLLPICPWTQEAAIQNARIRRVVSVGLFS